MNEPSKPSALDAHESAASPTYEERRPRLPWRPSRSAPTTSTLTYRWAEGTTTLATTTTLTHSFATGVHLLTFTVTSFTSVRSGLDFYRLPRAVKPLYEGALVRDRANLTAASGDWPISPNAPYRPAFASRTRLSAI